MARGCYRWGLAGVVGVQEMHWETVCCMRGGCTQDQLHEQQTEYVCTQEMC